MPRNELVRLAADGSALVTARLDTIRPSGNPVLIAQPGGIIALIPESDGLRWLRVNNDGTVIGEAFTDLIGPDHTVTITNAKLWPNGSASVATWQRFANCNISPPTACPRPASTLLRLNADGSERWRVEAGEVLAFIGFDDDGSSLIAESWPSPPLRLRQVSASGVAGMAFVAANGEPISLSGTAGPIRGRYIAHSDTERLLIDRNGTVLARRSITDGAGGPALAKGEAGFVVLSLHGDGALVSADDLSVLAQFDVDGIDNTFAELSGNLFWSLLDDGTAYTNSRGRDDSLPPRRARISRFAVPGSPAADILFVSRFD
jgi:hypothetical protein